jgi:hypothetical protein
VNTDVPDGSREMSRAQSEGRAATGVSDVEGAQRNAESQARGATGADDVSRAQSSAEGRVSSARSGAEGDVRSATDVEGRATAAGESATSGVRGAEGDLRSQQREVQQFDGSGDFYDQRATVEGRVDEVQAAPETAQAAATDPVLERTRGVRDAEGAADRAKAEGMDRVDGDFYDSRATVDVGESGVSGSADASVKKPVK